MITFGPYLARVSEKRLLLPKVEDTGYVLEYARPEQGVRIPIYRRTETSLGGFHDYLLHSRDTPFSFQYQPYYAVQSERGLFVSLENLIVALYKEGQVARPLTDFLSEFCDALPLPEDRLFSNRRPRAAFTGELTRMGYCVVDVWSYGRRLSAGVGWSRLAEGKDNGSAGYIWVGYVIFHPRPDGTLSEGRWVEPRYAPLGGLLRGALDKACPGPPVRLLSEGGKRMLLEPFEWTRLARMTNKEARAARVAFARSHPELLGNPKELALALQQEQLYSQMTPVPKILKHLDSIIAEARG